VAKRSASEIFADARAAGFGVAQATIMTAIALAESGGDDTNLGDQNLEDGTWGPSFGLFQVRTLKAQTGSGQDRDVSWLAASDANQAAAAFDISGHGANFSPWTTYTRGTYQQFLPQAQAAAAAAGGPGGATPATPAGGGSSGGLGGPWWLPWNLPGAAADAVAGSALSGTRFIVLEGVFAVLGLGLLGAGLARTFQPQIQRAKAAGEKKAAQAAKLATVAL
jgi:hypothetical protein